MDSNGLERERGITILAKNTAPFITIRASISFVNMPGHSSDFGGEVERPCAWSMACSLSRCYASEGPPPQTRYVLQKPCRPSCLPSSS